MDCWTETARLQRKLYGTRGDLQKEDYWTETTRLQSKLYGTRGDLQRTAKFVIAAGLPLLSTKAKKKEEKEKQHACTTSDFYRGFKLLHLS